MSSTRGTKEQRVAEILQTARELFSERGYEATSMAEVAARVGVVEGTVYKYFESKRELLLLVLTQWYESLFEGYEQDLEGVRDTHARMRLLIWRHLRTMRDNPDLCRLTFNEFRAEQGYHGSPLQKLNRAYTELLVEALQAGIAAGALRDDLPVTLLRDMIFGGIEHYIWPYLCGHGELEIDSITDQVCSLLWQGIGKADEQNYQRNFEQETRRLSELAERLEQKLGTS